MSGPAVAEHELASALPDATPPDAHPRRWLALGVLLVAGLMDLLDTTIVNVALPVIRRDLSATYASLQWILAGYALAFALTLITGGRLGDAFGRKRMFIIGVGGFVLASTLSGVAPSAEILIAARIVQGLMAALMIPQVLSVIQVTFHGKERATALAAYGGATGLAAISGPIIGGLLLKADLFGLGWRPIFLVNIPIGIAVLIAAAKLLPESRAPNPARPDVVGVALATLALLALLYPLVQGRELGWPAWTFACLGAVVPLVVVFLLHERWRGRRGGAPVVSLGLFADRGFTAGLLVVLTLYAGIAGFFLVYTLYAQIGLGFSPLRTGLTSAPLAVGAMFTAGASAQLVSKHGRRVLDVGAILLAIGMAVLFVTLAEWGPVLTSWQLIPGMLIGGLGLGLITAPVANVILANVSHQNAGSASGLLSTSIQLGAAIGIAVLGVMFFAILPGRSERSAAALGPGLYAQTAQARLSPSAGRRVVADFQSCTRDKAASRDPSSVPSSCRRVAVRASGRPQLERALSSATTRVRPRAFTDTMLPALGCLIATFAACFLLLLLVPATETPSEASAPSSEATAPGGLPARDRASRV